MMSSKALFVILVFFVGFLVVFMMKSQMYQVLRANTGRQRSLSSKSRKYTNLVRKMKKYIKPVLKGKKLKTTELCSHVWQEKYIKLHQDILEAKRPPNFLMFDCGGIAYGCGGYGNRVGAISAIFLLAILTNRAFLINWKGNITILDYMKPKKINWDVNKVKLKDLTTRHHMWGKGFHKNLPIDTLRFQGEKNKNFMQWFERTNFNHYFSFQVEKITSQWYFITSIWNNKFFSNEAARIAPKSRGHKYSFMRCAYQFLFQRTPRFEQLLQEARDRLNWKSNVFRIGIHFRAGDYSFKKKRKSDSSVLVRLEKYFNCAQRLETLLKHISPSIDPSTVKWFLATDNIELKKYSIKKYPKKLQTLSNQLEHISHKEPSRAGLEGVLMDNVLLSECDILIMSESTFSNTALGVGSHSLLLNSKGEKCIY